MNLTFLAAAIVSFGASSSALATGGNEYDARIFPPQSRPYGKTYSQWETAWWRWATAIPAANSPLIDQTGANAAIGQSGPVWFLAGNLTGGVSERTVVVPRGKALFFPILNQIYLGFPCDDRNLPGCEIDQAFEQANDIASLLSFISPSMNGAALSSAIDGLHVHNLPSYRIDSTSLFSVSLPDENLFGVPAGSYHPCVATGYYLMLAPLKPGRHTIRFMGVNADGSFSLDVTYHITVTKHEDDGENNDDGGKHEIEDK